MEQSSLNPKRNANTPRIYVASLADYNAGRLHGCWIDADQPILTIREEIAEMLAESKEPIAEEWAIHDYENFGDLQLSEFEDIHLVADVAFEITQHGPVFASLLSHLGGISGLDEARLHMEDCYRGTYDSLTDFAREFTEECFSSILNTLPSFILYHIDYEAIARDMEMSGDVRTFQVDGKLHVFC